MGYAGQGVQGPDVRWSEDVEGVGGMKAQGLCRTRGSQRGDRGWGRGGPASGEREHGDGKTVTTQAATQVPLTLSRPFLLF